MLLLLVLACYMLYGIPYPTTISPCLLHVIGHMLLYTYSHAYYMLYILVCSTSHCYYPKGPDKYEKLDSGTLQL